MRDTIDEELVTNGEVTYDRGSFTCGCNYYYWAICNNPPLNKGITHNTEHRPREVIPLRSSSK